jgi:DNA (cytosine-5)-methyltransferase 1
MSPYKMNSLNYRLIDLFAGAGGMTLGFVRDARTNFTSNGRFVPVWANDINPDATATYNANFGAHCVAGDLQRLLETQDALIPKADVVIGGPPCQGFSQLNRQRVGDPRRMLWRPFLQVVERCGARVFVMENVPGLLGSPEYNEIEKAACELGFRVVAAALCSADYGVAQVRRRAFIVGCQFTDPREWFPPRRTHYNPRNGALAHGLDFTLYESDAQPWRTVAAAIGDLPDEPCGTEFQADGAGVERRLALHVGRNPTELSLRRYRTIPPGGNRFDLPAELNIPCWTRKPTGGTDLFGRLWWDRPAVTIRTEFYKPEKGRYLHPVLDRPITHREAARLQSFPDWFEFRGSKTQVATQIGNAVPPLLAAAVAGAVAALLDSEDNRRA